MLWNIIVTILIGALAGWLAGLIMKTKGGFWFNAVLGIVGSFVGYLLAGFIGITASRVSIGGVLISVAGACIVIWLVRTISGKKK
ncbi:MAG: GlsB/YeaQ/YmgE family stress response membrane protein [Clostridia bacterium]|nr:GlsB/YeaQ/YmgE family stress response membrane protein [Clostridia bacterium]NCC69747.1 GlsB/YeaQ/YmgE family stress response membrane protein [Clostridia bacterium]